MINRPRPFFSFPPSSLAPTENNHMLLIDSFTEDFKEGHLYPECIIVRLLDRTGLRMLGERERREPAYLTTLMTRHVMRAAVSTQMKITMFFRVGRCAIRGEIRDPTVASVTLFVTSSSLMMDEDDDEDDDVEFNCVAGEDRVCGTQLTRHRAAIIKVKARLCATMISGGKEKKKRKEKQGSFSFLQMKCDSSCHIIQGRFISVRFFYLHNKENVTRKHPSLCLCVIRASFNAALLGPNMHLLLKRVSLEVSCCDSFLIALGLGVEMGIIRLRKSSAGWTAAPSAEEEHYVGCCCLHDTLGIYSTYRPADNKKGMRLFL